VAFGSRHGLVLLEMHTEAPNCILRFLQSVTHLCRHMSIEICDIPTFKRKKQMRRRSVL
jgi:hypothetical protein